MAGLTVRFSPASWNFSWIPLAFSGNHNRGFGQELWSGVTGRVPVSRVGVGYLCFGGTCCEIFFVCDFISAGSAGAWFCFVCGGCWTGLLWWRVSDSCISPGGCGPGAVSSAACRIAGSGRDTGSVLRRIGHVAGGCISVCTCGSAGIPRAASLLQLPSSLEWPGTGGAESSDHVVRVAA